jgi:hypothetical protein
MVNDSMEEPDIRGDYAPPSMPFSSQKTKQSGKQSDGGKSNINEAKKVA